MGCSASYPTGETAADGRAIHRECLTPDDEARFALLPSGWAVSFRLCRPHAELWDDEAGCGAVTLTFGRAAG